MSKGQQEEYRQNEVHVLRIEAKKIADSIVVCDLITSYGPSVEIMMKRTDFDRLESAKFFHGDLRGSNSKLRVSDTFTSSTLLVTD